MPKKYLYLAIGILLILLVIVLILVLSNRKNKPKVTPASLNQIYQGQVLFPAISADQQKVLFFNNLNEAAFYQLDLTGQNNQKVSKRLDTPDNIIWSPKKDRAILQVTYSNLFERYGSPFASPGTGDQTITFWQYDFSNKKLSKLASEIKDIIWSSDGQNIVYTFYNQDTLSNNVNIARPDGSDWKPLFAPKYSIQKVISYNPATKTLVFGTIGNNETDNKLDIYQETDGNQAQLLIDNVDVDSIYPSPDGQQVAVLKNKIVYLIDAKAAKSASLGLQSSKLIAYWSDNQTLIVALRPPQEIKDAIYQIDTATEEKKLWEYKDSSINVRHLIYFKSNNLYFTSQDDLLYQLVINQ